MVLFLSALFTSSLVLDLIRYRLKDKQLLCLRNDKFYLWEFIEVINPKSKIARLSVVEI